MDRPLATPGGSRAHSGRASAVVRLGLALLLAAPTAARAAIVVNEIMYDSPGPDVEYVEIYNTGAEAVDLTDWYLLDSDLGHPKCFLSGSIGSGEYRVIPGILTDFTSTYPGVTNVIPTQFDSEEPGEGFGLGNGGDTVRLFDAGDVLRDVVPYNDTPPWPVDAAGGGSSLELIHPALNNFVAQSWGASVDDDPPGTPGAVNSIHVPDAPPFVEDVTRSPALPGDVDAVAITARVNDDVGLSTVELHVDRGTGYVAQPMFDDGAHGDGSSGDQVFGASIGPEADGTLVRYYVSAADTLLQSTTVPSGAPADYMAYTVGHRPPYLRINELLAVNDDGALDEMGEAEDWVEIRNLGVETVDLAGMFLHDDLSDGRGWQLPARSLDPGEFLLVWCDDETDEGDLHADFVLPREGGQIGLFESVDRGNVLIHGLAFGLQSSDVSFGFLPDDGDAPEYVTPPTPEASNDGAAPFSSVCINEFQTTSAMGGVDDWIELYNRGPGSVDLNGWFLSDEVESPFKFVIPSGTVLDAGATVSFDEVALGFSMSSTGAEIIQLTHSDGTTGQDYFDFGPQIPDVSQGRLPDGSSNWHFMAVTSEDDSNACGAAWHALDPVSGLRLAAAGRLDWDPLPEAEHYDLVKGDLGGLLASGGDFAAAVTDCMENNGTDPRALDLLLPATGQAWFYLVRAADFSCGFGTYDTGSAPQSGSRDGEIAAAPPACP